MSLSRRNFIKGVIAGGAVASSGAYLFRGSLPLLGQTSAPGSVERLLTLTVNGQTRRVDVMPQSLRIRCFAATGRPRFPSIPRNPPCSTHPPGTWA